MFSERVSNKEIWEKIERFNLKQSNDGRFLAILISEYEWTANFAEQAIREYEKFIYLVAISDIPLMPPKVVDQVWKVHLYFTDHYWNKFCQEIFGKKVSRRPRTDENKIRDMEQFNNAVKLYKKEFRINPPAIIWDNHFRGMIILAFFGLEVLIGLLGYAGLIPTSISVSILIIILFLTLSLLGWKMPRSYGDCD